MNSVDIQKTRKLACCGLLEVIEVSKSLRSDDPYFVAGYIYARSCATNIRGGKLRRHKWNLQQAEIRAEVFKDLERKNNK